MPQPERLLFLGYCYFYGVSLRACGKAVQSVTATSYSDASSWGWRGYVVQVGGSMSKGNFSKFEADKGSTWRELQSTFNVLRSSVELIESQILKHRTDNKNVERVLSVGSRTPELQELVVDIFRLCIQHNIQLV